jgi:uncharacterized membrane protein YhaH (DUF805 family)
MVVVACGGVILLSMNMPVIVMVVLVVVVVMIVMVVLVVLPRARGYGQRRTFPSKDRSRR